MSVLALWVSLGAVLIAFVVFAFGLLVYCCLWGSKDKKPAAENVPYIFPDAQQRRLSVGSVRLKENHKGTATGSEGRQMTASRKERSAKADLVKVVVVAPAVTPVLVKPANVKVAGGASKKEKSVERSSKPKPKNEPENKSKHNEQTIIGDLGGVSLMKEDPSMRTLIKGVREVPMPRMSRKDWLRATKEVFEQQELHEQVEADVKSSKNQKLEIVNPVSIDWAQSVIYVMPNNEFTQESETTQSSQMPASASMREPVFPSGVMGDETVQHQKE